MSSKRKTNRDHAKKVQRPMVEDEAIANQLENLVRVCGKKFFGGGRVWGRVDSFKLSTADFESINLTEDSQFYLFIIKRVSHNN
jgi:hypothetical protein